MARLAPARAHGSARLLRVRSLCSAAVLAVPAALAPPAAAKSVLFVRGADRSGGFLEAGDDSERTEQLADVDNQATFGGNHGWFELAETLRGAGYQVSQVKESVEPGKPNGPTDGVAVDFGGAFSLDGYDVVVMGSNNARYSPAQVDALESFVRGGGGAIFISDANFGSDWADASDSDQPFLDRFGLVVNQDRGTYAIEQAAGEFLLPDHPLLRGVDRFDGEGVTPITVDAAAAAAAGVTVEVLATAEGSVRRNRGPFGANQRGPATPATAEDAVLLAAQAGAGRVVGLFDRNTFFNRNGAGTDIDRLDNRQLALNVFAYAAVPEPASAALLGAGALLLGRRRSAD
ncbi:DUF4350 domain-containing protein [Phycisphaera mikurensis]|nr:DUF4350 domain-containing protein [Phycisphaera mikurensis]MBB6442955.1 hypothetical protein [Phycisphaera mikurensis]